MTSAMVRRGRTHGAAEARRLRSCAEGVAGQIERDANATGAGGISGTGWNAELLAFLRAEHAATGVSEFITKAWRRPHQKQVVAKGLLPVIAGQRTESIEDKESERCRAPMRQVLLRHG